MKNNPVLMAAVVLVTGLTAASMAAAGGSCGSESKATNVNAHGAVIQTVGTTTTSATADIVDTAVAAGSFKTLAAALQAAGLVDALKGEGPFTVFAPTDEAFAKLPAADLNALLADKAALTKVLTYHVVSGTVLAADVVKLNKATTLEGSTVNIKANKQGVRVNKANVIATDILASNGVIHVIDEVLLPR
jgi:uncharacterized surface protein with fasciclin (FAS1) repeats